MFNTKYKMDIWLMWLTFKTLLKLLETGCVYTTWDYSA